MRIVIDLQGAQSSGSARRGIGRYSSSLALAMARKPRSHEIVLALNSRFPELSDELRQAFSGLVDPQNIHSWIPPAFSPSQSQASRRATERLYESFLASLKPDAVHVTSLFEGLVDAATASIGSLVSQPTAVTLYDLIPLINADRYLADPNVRSWYLHKVESLRRADLLLSISESSRREGIDALHLSSDRIVNISTAAYGHFKPLELEADQKSALLARYGLHKPFVMYTGGIDLRKNIDGLIKAFARMPLALRSTRQLAIVCAAREEDMKALLELALQEGLRAGDVVMTGFVSEEDLVAFYNLCELFVFPSWHEGFGLPALEAMHCGAAVIGANTSSVPEVIGRDDALFDPRDPSAIAEKMSAVLSNPEFALELRRHGPVQAARFSWEASAQKALDGIEQLHDEQVEALRGYVAISSARPCEEDAIRPRMAFLSPLPPDRSGIADYSAELLPALAKHYRIELVTLSGNVVDPVLGAEFPVRSVEWFVDHAGDFDRILYHLGNSDFHAHMFDLVERIPGVVVLHDFFLSGALAHMELHTGKGPVWRQALYRSHGYAALAALRDAKELDEVIYRFPCSLDVLECATAVISHSTYSRQLAQEWFGERAAGRLRQVDFPKPAVLDASGGRRLRARQALALSADTLLVCAFGMVNRTKLNQRLVDCWKRSKLGSSTNTRLVFVGQNDGGPYGQALTASIASFREGGIEITGWIDQAAYRLYLEAADMAVQLRSLSRGETSAAVLDAMSQGVATIVNANGSMASIEKECVWMLPDEFSDAELVSALEVLGMDAQRRRAIGKNALRKVIQSHSPDACALAYAEVIESAVHPASDNVMRRGELVKWLRDHDPLPDGPSNSSELLGHAQAISSTFTVTNSVERKLIDVSVLRRGCTDNDTLGPLKKLLEAPLSNGRVELVAWCEATSSYRLERRFSLSILGFEDPTFLDDAQVDFTERDTLTVLTPNSESPAHTAALAAERASGLPVNLVSVSRFRQHVLEAFGIDVAGDLVPPPLAASQMQVNEAPEAALAAAGLPRFAEPDFNHLLHYLRGAELAKLPKGVDCFVSVGCAGTWYFEWVQELCEPARHIGIEFYSPMPTDLPGNAEWICNTAGDMSDVADATADVLFSGQNIEHLFAHDIVAFLRESHRVIKPGGLLVIDSPNRLAANDLGWSHPEHLLELTPDEMRSIARTAGFDVTSVRGAWACADEVTGEPLPLTPFATTGSLSVASRIEFGARAPDKAFSWWLEARRSNRPPDWAEVTRVVGECFAVGWPERVNRITIHCGSKTFVDGVPWVSFIGPPGLILTGPPMPLPKGRFTVAFEVRGKHGLLPANHLPLLAVDVIAADGSQIAARIISGAQLQAGSNAASVSFELTDTTFGLTFRLMAMAPSPIEVRYGVLLTSHDDQTYSVASVGSDRSHSTSP